MSPGIVTTPLGAAIQEPPPRPGGLPGDLLPAFLAVPGTEAALATLSDRGVLAVTTGQQPGLFTGPLYTIYKALSTAALARALEQRWQRPVVPIFWLAGDDHDFAEANHASWLNADGAVVTARLRERPAEAALTPMYREPLGPEVENALEALERDLPASEFRDNTIGWLRRHYRPDHTVAGAFGHALAELLAKFGILCFDSTHPAAKRAAAPVLLSAVRDSGTIDRGLAERARELVAAGRDPGIPVGDGALLVMVEARLGRDRLIRSATGMATRRSGEAFDQGGLERIGRDQPERLSPNVLLRPVIESALLPTVAYLGGPGELRYLDLTPPIYEALGIHRQVPLPRWSGVVVEHRVERVLEKFGANLEELLAPGGALESRVVRAIFPEEATAALAKLRADIEQGYGALLAAAHAIDPTLEKPVLNTRNHALSGTQDIEKRLVQHLKKRQEVEISQIARARTAVLPHGVPQERVLTVAPFLSRYGPALLDDLYGRMNHWYVAGLEAALLPS